MAREHEILNNWGTELFVGKNSHYYRSKWEKSTDDRMFQSWNWAAFLFPFFWFAYRRMYIEAFFLFLASAFSLLIPLSGLGIKIFVGLYANSLYRRKALKVIRNTNGMLESDARIYIEKNGGTSIISVFTAIFLSLILSGTVILGIVLYSDSAENTSSTSTELTSENRRLSTESTYEVMTNGGEITFTVPDDFVREYYDGQDLYCNSRKEDFVFIVFLYRPEDFSEEMTERSVLSIQVDELKKISDLEFLPDANLPELGDEFVQNLYYTSSDGEAYYWYTTCEKIGQYYVVTAVAADDWEKAKDLSGDIVSSAELTKKEL